MLNDEETVKELRLVSQYHKRDELRPMRILFLDITVGVLSEFRLLDDQSLGVGGWRALSGGVKSRHWMNGSNGRWT